MTLRRRIEEVYEDGRRWAIVEELDKEGRGKRIVTEEGPLDDGQTKIVGDYRDTEVIAEEEVVQSHANPWDMARGWIRASGLWVMVALGIVETLLAFRLAFQLAGANPNNDFVDLIYDLTGPMVNPFEGIVSVRSVANGVFEPATAIAMAVFFLAAIVLIAALWTVTAFSWPVDRSVTTRSQRRTHALREER